MLRQAHPAQDVAQRLHETYPSLRLFIREAAPVLQALAKLGEVRQFADEASWAAAAQAATRESLEDYTLRFAPRSYRTWSPAVVAISALGGISQLWGYASLIYGFGGIAMICLCDVIAALMGRSKKAE